MSQMYCTKCEAPLEYGATATGRCPKCDALPNLIAIAATLKEQHEGGNALTLLVELRAAQAALEPFARHLQCVLRVWPDLLDNAQVGASESRDDGITLADLRHAAAVLAQVKDTP